LFESLPDSGIHKLLLAGIEAHVCVQQTVLDLLTHGFHVFVAADAVGSRFEFDRDIALRRMESAGVNLTTTEAALFEWCEAAGTPEFKQVSALVREEPPSDA
jgi:nicotinamidase-related amidase